MFDGRPCCLATNCSGLSEGLQLKWASSGNEKGYKLSARVLAYWPGGRPGRLLGQATKQAGALTLLRKAHRLFAASPGMRNKPKSIRHI